MAPKRDLDGITFPEPPTNLQQRIFEAMGRAAPACPIEDTVVISGTGRSGSTWLGEMLRGVRGYKYLNEPFMDTPLRRRTYLNPERVAPEPIQEYVHRALTGQIWRSWKWRFEANTSAGMLYEFTSRRKVVVKFTRALRMIRWMRRHFLVRGAILLVRHPCAVISSMLRHGGGWHEDHLQNLGDSPTAQVFGRNLPEEVRLRFEEEVAGIEHRDEVLAHLWALDYHLALFEQERQPWVIVPYERLLKKRTEELHRIASALDLKLTPKVLQSIDTASTSASEDVRTADVQRQLAKWKDHLSEKQVDRILSIAHLYDIDMYADGVEPDYARLNAFQKPQYAW